MEQKEAIDGIVKSKKIRLLFIRQMRLLLNGSYIETGTYNGEVITDADESINCNAAKKYAEQLGSHYFMLTNVGEDYIYSHSFLVKLISFISFLAY